MVGRTHLVIGDSHAKPGINNDRYTWAGRLAVDLKPDVIIDIGDWADMESLSSYDRGKKSFEGRRYKNDVDAALDARAKFNAPIDEYNAKRGRKKLKGYYPEKHHIEGNHENRINRAINDTPELDGTISTADLGYKEYGWKHNPFLVPVAIDGVYYSHYFTSGVMGRPIGGEAPASSILKKHFVSCTAGHIHTRDFGERTRADGTRILGMVAGCYFEHDEAYAGAMPCMMWWRGLVIKRHVQGGDYDPEFMGMAAIRSRYA